MSNHVTPKIEQLRLKLELAIKALHRVVAEEHAEGEGICNRHVGCESPEIARTVLEEIRDGIG
jgi:hypothetical protein